MLIRFALVGAILASAPLLYAASAQSGRAADSNEAIAALVSELRAVRVELSQAAERSLRFQLLLARLQLQEQRIGHLDRQRGEIIKSLMDSQAATSLFAAQFERMQRGCAETADALERKACEAEIGPMKATASSQQEREQQLRLQEQELSQAIATEQSRWADFSSRLDELERALSRQR